MAYIALTKRVVPKVFFTCGVAGSAGAAESTHVTATVLLKEPVHLHLGASSMIFFYWGLTFLASYNIYLAATASWQLWRQPQRLQQNMERWSYVAGFTLRPKVFVTALWAGLMVIVTVCLIMFMTHPSVRHHVA